MKTINMGKDLRCPHCEDNLGKFTENPVDVRCGTCGTEFFNGSGYVESEQHLREIKIKYPRQDLPKTLNTIT